MSLDLHKVLKNKLHLKKINLWRFLTLLLFIAVLYLTIDYGDSTKSKQDYIARVSIKGFVSNDVVRIEKLRKLKNDKKLKALIVDIDSPGGSVVGGELLYEALNEISQEKVTVAFVGSQATSAAYLAAIGCDYIIAPKGSIVGSIGVILQSLDLRRLAESLGIDPILIKSTALKGVPHVAEGLTKEGEIALREVIGDIYKMFSNIVLEKRKIPDEFLDEVISGKIFSGVQAANYNLVDITGNYNAVIEYIKQKGISEDLKVIKVNLDKKKTPVLFKILSPIIDLFSYSGVLAINKFW